MSTETNQKVICEYCSNKGIFTELCDAQNRSIYCPYCKPVAAEHQALAKVVLPGWDNFWSPLEAKYMGPFFQKPPWLLVIHCGSTDGDIARYFADATDDRKVSSHLAWSKAKQDFKQCVPFVRVAWHCAGATLRGYKHLNFCSVGIEGPGPDTRERTDEEYKKWTSTLLHLKQIIPSLTTAVGHGTIDPKRRRDPGKNFNWDIVRDCGFDVATKQ